MLIVHHLDCIREAMCWNKIQTYNKNQYTIEIFCSNFTILIKKKIETFVKICKEKLMFLS